MYIIGLLAIVEFIMNMLYAGFSLYFAWNIIVS